MRGERGQPFQRGARAIAFIAVATDFSCADLLARLLIEERHGRLHGSDLSLEESLLLSAGGPLLAEKGVFVLRAAAYFVALGHDVCGITHDHEKSGRALI